MRRTSSYQQYMNYYSQTANAYAIAPAVSESDFHHTVVRPRKVRDNTKTGNTSTRSLKRRKSEVIKIAEDAAGHGLSLQFIITIMIIFTGVVAMIMSSAAIRKNQLDISAMRIELQRLVEEGATVKAEIAEKYDVVQIEKIAMAKFAMSKPKPYQTQYITVPKQSSVVQHRIASDGYEELGLIGKAVKLVSDVCKSVGLGKLVSL